MKEMEDIWRATTGFIVAMLIGAVTWIVRTVFTNQQGLKLLELKQDLQHADMVKELRTLQVENKEVVVQLKKLNETMIRAEEHDKRHTE